MNIRKLPSGNYQIRLMEDGISYQITVDHKPTQTEALKLISDIKPISHDKYTLVGACEAFLKAKENILSVSTVRGYRVLMGQIEPILAKTKISRITKPMIQTEVDRYSISHSPKSTRNYGVFITTVLGFYGNEITKIQYPQKVKHQGYIPTVPEVKKILKHLEGTPYYIPVFLGTRGLRLSEVCGLNLNSLSDDNMLTIDKAKVRGERCYSVKGTKTTSSTRRLAIPDKIADLIRQQGYVYNGAPHIITRNLQRAEKALGITPFTFHQLRHFFASYTHYNGIVDKDIQDEGGWANDITMKNAYRQGMNQEKTSKKIARMLEKDLL